MAGWKVPKCKWVLAQYKVFLGLENYSIFTLSGVGWGFTSLLTNQRHMHVPTSMPACRARSTLAHTASGLEPRSVLPPRS